MSLTLPPISDVFSSFFSTFFVVKADKGTGHRCEVMDKLRRVLSGQDEESNERDAEEQVREKLFLFLFFY